MSHLNTVCVCAFVCVDTGIHTSEHVDESQQTTIDTLYCFVTKNTRQPGPWFPCF